MSGPGRSGVQTLKWRRQLQATRLHKLRHFLMKTIFNFHLPMNHFRGCPSDDSSSLLFIALQTERRVLLAHFISGSCAAVFPVFPSQESRGIKRNQDECKRHCLAEFQPHLFSNSWGNITWLRMTDRPLYLSLCLFFDPLLQFGRRTLQSSLDKPSALTALFSERQLSRITVIVTVAFEWKSWGRVLPSSYLRLRFLARCRSWKRDAIIFV